ncbi:hypothetical protein [Spirosoma pollinicola]|uniref:Uncharacterized protein n=1 Tax=Spirosoma pollinicola TaxID=2057025 RepID=A0A2K8Z8B1_9BACT|nr:hypothetical protein [Spirosoma pollinicola]AUD06115.1 hypothetical protein CWM47_32290 [Spirosoma pollinicola]
MKASDQLIEQVSGLSTVERTDLLSKLPQKLDSDDQNHLTTSSLNATKDGAKVDILTKSIKGLSVDDRKTVAQNIALAPPSGQIRDRIWMVVIWAFVILIVGSFIALSISLFTPEKTPDEARVQIMVTVFTTAAAFLTGLLAPSPMTIQKDT